MATSDLSINKNKNKNIIINFNNIKRFKSYSYDHHEAVMFTTSFFFMATSDLSINKNKNKNKNIIINFNNIKRFKSYS